MISWIVRHLKNPIYAAIISGVVGSGITATGMSLWADSVNRTEEAKLNEYIQIAVELKTFRQHLDDFTFKLGEPAHYDQELAREVTRSLTRLHSDFENYQKNLPGEAVNKVQISILKLKKSIQSLKNDDGLNRFAIALRDFERDIRHIRPKLDGSVGTYGTSLAS